MTPEKAERVLDFIWQRLVGKYDESPNVDYMLNLAEIIECLKFGEGLLGLRATTPTPSVQPSESASPMAGGSSEAPADILLAALKALKRSHSLSNWSLIVDTGQLNFTCEVKPRSDATASEPRLRHGWEWSERNQTYQRSPSKT